ncbi:BMC domain-containing protein [Desulforamulus ruminis]|uniref:Microcompartments protein n=1 Tax=Desulforamulus ruminis (strain ATCC 23193 / DSM 2154 / NCIMB 8452 / DL) TaxID=696281 RepID=F6DK15_DESRL|nr:BMC domain-containing protein [Desulforamulus ruminis]AEG60329.1 microcompartments protein [Desulforamulus ruminis DSM 2154]
MQALGLIETRGLLPAIECADVMVKTAQVELVERTLVGGGLVTIIVTGDVGAVKAAVEAGVAAVEKIDPSSLVSQHVIPRPHPDMESLVTVSANPVGPPPSSVAPEQDRTAASREPEAAITTENAPSEPMTLKHYHKEEVDAFVQTYGLEKSVNALKLLPVVKLRQLAREYKKLNLAGRAISKANKDLLIEKLTEYYRRETNK